MQYQALADTLFSKQLSLVDQASDHTKANLFGSQLFFLTHAQRAVREHSFKSISSQRVEIRISILTTFHDHLSTKSIYLQSKRYYANALLSTLSKEFPKESFPLAFGLSHFPSIGPTAGFRHWKLFQKYSKIPDLDSVALPLAQEILSDKFLLSHVSLILILFPSFTYFSTTQDQELNQTAFYVIKTLAQFPKTLELFTRRIWDVISKNSSNLKDISDEQLAIYETPEDEIYQKDLFEQKVEEFLQSKSKGKDQKPKKYSGMSAKEDEEWERNLRKELEEKQRKEFAKEIEEVKLKIQEEEQEVRKEVNQSLRPLELSLKFIHLLKIYAPLAANDLLSMVIPGLVELIKKEWPFPPVNDFALSILISLANVLDPVLSPLQLKLAGGVYQILVNPSKAVNQVIVSNFSKPPLMSEHF